MLREEEIRRLVGQSAKKIVTDGLCRVAENGENRCRNDEVTLHSDHQFGR